MRTHSSLSARSTVPRLVRRGSIIAAIAAVTLLAPLPARAQWSTDPTNSNALCSAFFGAQWLATVSDGTGGAYFTWADERGAGFTNRAFIQRVTAPGLFAAGWVPQATRVCSVEAAQNEPVAAFDGRAVYVAWTDLRAAISDIYVQRVLPDGTIAPGWPTGGVRLSLGGQNNHAPVICSNGLGGAVVAWVRDSLAADQNIQAAKVDSTGSVKALVTIAAGVGSQNGPVLVNYEPVYFPGDVVLAYQDNAGGNYNIRALGFGASLGVDWGPTDICNAVGDQTDVRIATDGFPYIYFVWNDQRTAVPTIYEQCNYLYWPGLQSVVGSMPNGVMVTNGTSTATLTSAAPDGAGNLLMGWEQPSGAFASVYAHRMTHSSVPASGWPWYGRAVCAGCASDEREIKVTSDGAGGLIATWRDNRNGNQYDIFAQRIDALANAGLNWPAAGLPVGASPFNQFYPSIAPDGSGDAIIAFRDARICPSCTDGPVANKVDHFGVLGDARPIITGIKDVKGDQGGSVKIVWGGSYLDSDPRFAIANYWLWREVPASLVAGQLRSGALVMDDALSADLSSGRAAMPSRGLIMTTTTASGSINWEFVESQPASGFPTYSAVVPTTRDSTSGTNPYTLFMVQARTAAGAYWNSPADSGYSVDNIPPYAPAPVAGTYSSGVTSMHWAPVLVPDLANYRVYRGTSPSFVPSPSNLRAAPLDTTYADAAGSPYFYRISAVDVHGNEGPNTLLTPSGVLGVGDHGLPGEVSLAQPRPNPARGSTTLSYALPQAGRVRLALYDVAGRQVRLLAEGEREAGNQSVIWDLRDDEGRAVSAGLYLARLEAGGRVITQRVLTFL